MFKEIHCQFSTGSSWRILVKRHVKNIFRWTQSVEQRSSAAFIVNLFKIIQHLPQFSGFVERFLLFSDCFFLSSSLDRWRLRRRRDRCWIPHYRCYTTGPTIYSGRRRGAGTQWRKPSLARSCPNKSGLQFPSFIRSAIYFKGTVKKVRITWKQQAADAYMESV